jgi:hypothetical protein
VVVVIAQVPHPAVFLLCRTAQFKHRQRPTVRGDPIAGSATGTIAAVQPMRVRRRKPMTHLPVSRDLQPLPQSRPSQTTATAWNRFTKTFGTSDFPIIVAICLAGLLLTLNFMKQYPDVGEIIQQYNLF